MTTCTRYPCGGTRHGCPMDDCPGRRDATALADELIAWVESYAKKVCPDGCLPTPGQEREISMFARITRALRAAPQTPDAVGRRTVHEAMLDAWNTICTDTGCHPLDIERRGRELFFNPGHWADLIALFLDANDVPMPEGCDWPDKLFAFLDEPGEHDPCYVVMPGGAMLSLNHHAGEGVDIARAKFIVAACNAALSTPSASAGPQAEAVNEPTPNWQRRWPHDQPNGWNLDGAAFLKLVQENPMLWLSLGRAKYLELRVDTRDGGFNLYDRDRKPLNPDDVVEAAAKTKAQFGEVAHPQPQQADGRGAVIEECARAVEYLTLAIIPDQMTTRETVAAFRLLAAKNIRALQQSPATDNAPAVSSRAQDGKGAA